MQSAFADVHLSLKLEANLRLLSLVLFRILVFTLLQSAVALVIDGVMCLNLLVGAFKTLFNASGAGSEGCVTDLEDSSMGVCSSLTSHVFSITSL